MLPPSTASKLTAPDFERLAEDLAREAVCAAATITTEGLRLSQLFSPAINLAGANRRPAHNLRHHPARPECLRHNLPLLLVTPTAPAFRARDHLTLDIAPSVAPVICSGARQHARSPSLPQDGIPPFTARGFSTSVQIGVFVRLFRIGGIEYAKGLPYKPFMLRA